MDIVGLDALGSVVVVFAVAVVAGLNQAVLILHYGGHDPVFLRELAIRSIAFWFSFLGLSAWWRRRQLLLQEQIVRRLLLQRLIVRPPTPPPHYLHFHLPDIDHDADLDPVPPYDEVEARDPPSPRRAPTPRPEDVAAVNELLEPQVVLAVADDIAEFDLL